MRLESYILLMGRSFRSAWARSFFAVAGVAVGAAVWVGAWALVWTARHYVAPRIEAVFPANRLVVKPRPIDIALIRMGPKRISGDQARDIEALPGVASVYRQQAITFPLMATLSILGQSIQTDAIVNGVDPELVREGLADGYAFAYSDAPDALVPVMASRYFLDMYNLGYAESQGLPRVNQAAVVGRTFQLDLGESFSIGSQSRSRTVTCQIVGLTDNISLIGLVVPLKYAETWNEWYHGQPATEYGALHVATASAEDYQSVRTALTERGFLVEGHQETLEQIQWGLAVVTWGSLFGGGLVVFLAGLNVWNTFTLMMMQQRRSIGVMRAVGATPGLVLGLYGAQLAVLIALGCLIGGGGAAWGIAAMEPMLSALGDHYAFLGDWTSVAGSIGRPGFIGLPLVALVAWGGMVPQMVVYARAPIRSLQ